MTPTDTLTRFTFSDIAYRGERVVLDKTYKEILQSYPYPDSIAQLLGEALVAISLISATVKFSGKVSLQLQNGKFMPLLFVEANHKGQLRGLAHWQGDNPQNNFTQLTVGGILAINLMPDNGNNYQGIVSLKGENLAECLNTYFQQSEQLTTGFWLVADNKKAAGLFLQEFPATSVDDKAYWPELEILSSTVKTEELIELSNETLLNRLYAEHDIQLFDTSSLEFHCPCSKEKALNSILMLPDEEIHALLKEQGKLESNCEFCRAEYSFSEDVAYNAMMSRSTEKQPTQ